MTIQFEVLQTAAPTSASARAEILANPGFGKAFTDHMVTIRWTEADGWHGARVEARRPFQIDPAASVLHYAQEIFEGMKAYRGENGEAYLFRPEENARRFARSASRMAMPELPERVFIEAVEQLVKIDQDWIPTDEGSLYLRPFMFSDEAFLGVRPAASYVFCIIASPAGAYFKGGEKAIRLWATPDYTRAARGGTGAAKCGGNYAGSLIAQKQAIEHHCDQVLFLDAAEGRWIEELGGMNVFFLFQDGTLRTPPAQGTILEGITRNSLLTLAREQGLAVEEAQYSFEAWQADAASGRLKEAFACGTAAVVAGIGSVVFPTGSFTIGTGETGPVTKALKERLVGIQNGHSEDTHNWVHPIR